MNDYFGVFYAAQNPPIPVVQREIKKEELYDAKEVIMCGGDTHIVAAIKLDGHQVRASRVDDEFY